MLSVVLVVLSIVMYVHIFILYDFCQYLKYRSCRGFSSSLCFDRDDLYMQYRPSIHATHVREETFMDMIQEYVYEYVFRKDGLL